MLGNNSTVPSSNSFGSNIIANSHSLFSGNYIQVDSEFTEQITGIDPVRMKYKSTPHAVIALNFAENHYQWILPTIKDGDISFTTELWNVNIICHLI